MVGACGCMKYLVAFLEEGSKCGVAYLEPPFKLTFVVGASEGPCLEDNLLIVVIVHVRSCQ